MEKVDTKDGSFTLYSKEYKQHYHNINDGALNESLNKHVIPAISHHKKKDELHILDICFGLGYNTWATLFYLKECGFEKKVHIYSPELDAKLLASLSAFPYPKEFEELKPIINAVAKSGFYEDRNLKIEVKIEDAREYIKTLQHPIHILYQDAFSFDVNKELWTKEYFCEIKKKMHKDGIITTYSIATPVRLALHVNGFSLSENKTEITRKGTLAFLKPIEEPIDMELKKRRNPMAKPLCD